MRRKIRKREIISISEIYLIYFKIIAAVYDIHLSKKELALMAHTAKWGTITSPPAKQAFVEEYKSSPDSLNNMISNLQKRDLLVKDDKFKVRVRPDLMKKFEDGEHEFNIKVHVDDSKRRADKAGSTES